MSLFFAIAHKLCVRYSGWIWRKLFFEPPKRISPAMHQIPNVVCTTAIHEIVVEKHIAAPK